jgi:hypothetical protein
MSFDVLGTEITPGQPWDMPLSRVEDNSLHVSFYAGRHGDAGVANHFKDRLDNNQDYMLGLDTNGLSDRMPGLLNFRLYGFLSINRELLAGGAFELGQGHTASVNNWWLGQDHAHSYPSDQGSLGMIEVYTEKNNAYCLSDDGNKQYRVYVVAGKCR